MYLPENFGRYITKRIIFDYSKLNMNDEEKILKI